MWCTIRDQEPGYQLSVTSARVHVRVNRVDVDTLLVQKELSFVVASLSIHSAYVSVVSVCLHVLRQFHRLHQCDGNQCCPCFRGSLRTHHQEWSLRLHSIQHWKTHQVLT